MQSPHFDLCSLCYCGPNLYLPHAYSLNIYPLICWNILLIVDLAASGAPHVLNEFQMSFKFWAKRLFLVIGMMLQMFRDSILAVVSL